jgi:hypothetical protein
MILSARSGRSPHRMTRRHTAERRPLMPELSLSKQALIELLERASPDPCEPYGCDPSEPPNEPPDPPPWEFPRWLRLNPQPLPPKGHWRSANAARTLIAQALTLHELTEALASDGGERALGVIHRKVSEFVDDWCGTRPHPKPFPWPWGRRPSSPSGCLTPRAGVLKDPIPRCCDQLLQKPCVQADS